MILLIKGEPLGGKRLKTWPWNRTEHPSPSLHPFLDLHVPFISKIDTSRICFNRHKPHEQWLEIEAGYERLRSIHYDLIANLYLVPLFCGHWSKFGKCDLFNSGYFVYSFILSSHIKTVLDHERKHTALVRYYCVVNIWIYCHLHVYCIYVIRQLIVCWY